MRTYFFSASPVFFRGTQRRVTGLWWYIGMRQVRLVTTSTGPSVRTLRMQDAVGKNLYGCLNTRYTSGAENGGSARKAVWVEVGKVSQKAVTVPFMRTTALLMVRIRNGNATGKGRNQNSHLARLGLNEGAQDSGCSNIMAVAHGLRGLKLVRFLSERTVAVRKGVKRGRDEGAR